ncbi:NCS2 family permease [Gammaproteobacteria bacterium]|nr:NCS2 family permease [Gammaproteobacteria bacterium]
MDFLSRYFEFEKHSTNFSKEILAGIATFLSMSYITVVNPSILSETGMDFGAVFVATCLAAAFGSAVMGLLANYPVALAPGMGQNAFFTYGVVIGLGHTWQSALGAVLISGVIFVVLSILPVRQWLINAIPRNLKLGIAAGIGFFLGFIALKNAGIIVDNQATLVGLGDLTSVGPLLCLAAFVLIVALTAKRITGAVVIGILLATLMGILIGDIPFMGVLSTPPSIAPVFFELDLVSVIDVSMLTVIMTMLLVDVFDTAGTLVGVSNRAGLLDEKGHLPKIEKALIADSSATMVGSVFGTSSTTSYVESAAGVEAGGRTGMVSVTVSILFLLCLFLAPLAKTIPSYATAAALLYVASVMVNALADLDWNDISETTPATICALSMPLTFSIADGIGLGFITYSIIKILSGKLSDCSAPVVIISVVFLLKFLFL